MGFDIGNIGDQALVFKYQGADSSLPAVELARYVFRSDAPADESPRPFFHPLRSLEGDQLTLYRPTDHRWHHGLSLSFANLSGSNFWGGATYVRGEGYRVLDNFGRVSHEAFDAIEADEGLARFKERLTWRRSDGLAILSEQRRVTASLTGEAELRRLGLSGLKGWALDFESSLHNELSTPLEFGSPTTEGRPGAGYGSLFWRGPRSFTGGEIYLASTGDRDRSGFEGDSLELERVDPRAAMGRQSPLLAFSGQHDESLRWTTLLFCDEQANPRFPTKWFVRSESFAAVSFSFIFDEPYVLAPGDRLDLAYRIVMLDGRPLGR